ncbi:MAG: hypothetical protein ABJA86_11890 [Nocardioidaceae bacterium]
MKMISKRTVQVAAAIALSIGVLPADSSGVAAAVGDPPFGAPQRIDDAASAAAGYNAAIDVDSAGNGVAVWQSNGVIYGSRRPVDGDWSAPTALMTTFGPDVVALREDGSAYFNYGIEAPDGEAIAVWFPDGSVASTNVFQQYAHGQVAADLDGDLIAYAETANGATTYHFAAADTDPIADGWTSTTTLQAFGSSRVTFGQGRTYFVAYPPDATGTDRRFRVNHVDGSTGHPTLLIRHQLCPTAGRLAGYDIGAGRSGAAVLAWRCTSRTADVIDVQRIHPDSSVGAVVELARSRQSGVKDRLSDPEVAFSPKGPTVLFSRANNATRRNVLAVSTDSSGKWGRPSIVVRGVAASSARALGARLDWVPGAALLTYRTTPGVIWAVRRLPGASFGAPAPVFSSAVTKLGAVAADGAALVAHVTQGRFASRFAPGIT